MGRNVRAVTTRSLLNPEGVARPPLQLARVPTRALAHSSLAIDCPAFDNWLPCLAPNTVRRAYATWRARRHRGQGGRRFRDCAHDLSIERRYRCRARSGCARSPDRPPCAAGLGFESAEIIGAVGAELAPRGRQSPTGPGRTRSGRTRAAAVNAQSSARRRAVRAGGWPVTISVSTAAPSSQHHAPVARSFEPVRRLECDRLRKGDGDRARSWRTRWLVDRLQPIAVARVLTAHRLEVDLLQPARVRPDLARADPPPVDLDHRRNLGPRPTQEQLVARVQLGAVDAALNERQPSSDRMNPIMTSRVMPSRMSSVTGGVTKAPSLNMNRFSAEPSLTWPSMASMMASS